MREALKGFDFSFKAALDSYIARLTPDNSDSNKKRLIPSRAPPTYRNRAQAKAVAYKKAQDHFQKAPKSLVEQILSGKLDSQDARTVLAIVTYVMYCMPRMTLNALFTEGDSKSSVARLGILTVCSVNHGHHT